MSYETKLNKNLKNTLRKFEKQELLKDIENYIEFINDNVFILQGLNYRVKSLQSILLKYGKYYPSKEVYGCYNDIIGFRNIINNYNEINLNSDLTRHVDMSNGKKNDDGYRGYHVYYQKTKYHYPIEIQFFTKRDYIFNMWLHKYVYKYKDSQIGVKLRKLYDDGEINNEIEFKEMLDYVLSSSKEI